LKPSRATGLAALLFVAVTAPAAAFALSGDSDESDGSRTPPAAAGHSAKAKSDESAKHEQSGPEQSDEASAAGRAHAEAMKKWAHCVAEAASGPKTGDYTGPPKDACDEKPVGPGREKHDDAGASTPGKSGEHHGQGRGHTH
jgi:hypothetical protein